MVSEEGISTDPVYIKAVQNWPRPKTPKKMKGFIGLCSYYKNYVKHFATIARQMHKLCDKGSRFQWNDACEQAFIRLKDALTSPGRQHNNADALSRRSWKVCLRHQEGNTEDKNEPECTTTIEQVRVTIGSKHSHSVEPNLMNSEIRESQLNDKKIKLLYNCISDKKGKT